MAAPAAFPPILSLKGVGPALAAKLEKLGVTDIRDLLLLTPLRYEDRSRVVPISQAWGGLCQIEGKVQWTELTGQRRPMLVCRLADDSGSLDLRFFHFSLGLRQSLRPGSRWRCFGEVKCSPFGREMIHPQLEPASNPPPGILPVYPTAAGISQKILRRLMMQALTLASEHPEWFPALAPEVQPACSDASLMAALEALHRPALGVDVTVLNAGCHALQRRLAWEELLAHHLSLRSLPSARSGASAPVLRLDDSELSLFLSQLSFRLTAAQHRVIEEIRSDLANQRPMGRLLQGDVGSGKTVVAACAALIACKAGCQVALMAPTELLAEQHWQNWRQWFEPMGRSVQFLVSRISGSKRRGILTDLSNQRIDIIIGTHALFQEDVKFADLGLIVVDEQHRFGVEQRLALKSKGSGGKVPHYLVMTATPIPRTLAMLRYGDLAVSVIDQLPPGRQPVITRILAQTKRERLLDRLRDWIEKGRQVYWVCTLIEESEALDCEAAERTAEFLRDRLPGVRIGLVHGRMKSSDKEQVMIDFKSGRTDLLVATTVIEVGVDVPNANLMVIENAERLGLAQLHQLRGRVGRGGGQSYCILLYKPPLTDIARQRLKLMRDCNDGFALAEKDLQLRGPGEVLGTRQSGALQFKITDPIRDQALLPYVRQAADWLEQHDTKTISHLISFWLGKGNRYADV